MYYNTNNLTLDELKEAVTSAKSQNLRVLEIFKGLKLASPSTVYLIYNDFFEGKTPITSIRRAINTLTNKGDLEKTYTTRRGIFGRKEYLWRCK